ncbi:MAG: 3'-5' exonuclease [Promethearchaeota archaeon]
MKLCVLDVETTGLDPHLHHLVEVGLVELDLDTGGTRVLFESLVREPGLSPAERDAWIFNNSDLSYEEVSAAPPLFRVRGEVVRHLRAYRTTAFNSQFDFGFLTERGIRIPNRLPCIMRVATWVVQIPKSWGPEPYKWPSAEETWDYLFPGEVYVEKHRAADDAEHEARILYEMYRRGVYRADDPDWVAAHFRDSIW